MTDQTLLGRIAELEQEVEDLRHSLAETAKLVIDVRKERERGAQGELRIEEGMAADNPAEEVGL